MTRDEQRAINRKAIIRAVELIGSRAGSAWRPPPSYKSVLAVLSGEGITNSRGRCWATKTFYLMLSRNGYSGLHGLNRARLAGAFDAEFFPTIKKHIPVEAGLL